MKHSELDKIVSNAWNAFFDKLEEQGIDADGVADKMGIKDCYNDVFDCVMEVAQ